MTRRQRLPWSILKTPRANPKQEQERLYLIQLGRDAQFDRGVLMEKLPDTIRTQLAACTVSARALFFTTLEEAARLEDVRATLGVRRMEAAIAKRQRKGLRRAQHLSPTPGIEVGRPEV